MALGGRLGVLSEAVAMAVVLSHPPPFMRASHMVTGDPDEANAIVGQSFVSCCHGGGGGGVDDGLVVDVMFVLVAVLMLVHCNCKVVVRQAPLLHALPLDADLPLLSSRPARTCWLSRAGLLNTPWWHGLLAAEARFRGPHRPAEFPSPRHPPPRISQKHRPLSILLYLNFLPTPPRISSHHVPGIGLAPHGYVPARAPPHRYFVLAA